MFKYAYVVHPSCKWVIEGKIITFSNSKYFYATNLRNTYNQWLYENLLNVWEDLDFAKSKIILFVNSKNNTWQFGDNMFISPIDLCSEDWARQYCCGDLIGNIESIIDYIQTTFPECINPLQFIKCAKY
jgi:hypothetical protein